MNRGQLDRLAAGEQFELNEGTLANGQWQYQPVRFSSEGFSQALDRLLATCPPAKPVATRDVVAGSAK